MEFEYNARMKRTLDTSLYTQCKIEGSSSSFNMYCYGIGSSNRIERCDNPVIGMMLCFHNNRSKILKCTKETAFSRWWLIK